MVKPNTWPPVRVIQRIEAHNEVAKNLRNFQQYYKSLNEEARSELPKSEAYLAKYLVISSTGLIEASRDDLAGEYARIVGPSSLHLRVKSTLQPGLGCRPKQLKAFFSSFNETWSEELKVFMERDDEELENNLGALVTTRGKLAHGGSIKLNSGQALAWSDASVKVTRWMINRFDPR